MTDILRRRPDGSLDADHYIALAHRNRSLAALDALRRIARALSRLLIRLANRRPGRQQTPRHDDATAKQMIVS